MLNNIESHSFLQNFIASNLNVSVAKKQKVLELKDPLKSAEAILKHMSGELNMLEIKNQIDSKVKGDIEEQQRNFYLNQQLKTIQEELGQNPQQEELEILVKKAKKKKWSEEASKAFSKTLDKVKRMNPQVAEYSIQMNYLELMLELPWEEYTKDNFNLKKVKTVLDKDHYGLEDVKQRILEHLAVLKLKGDMKAPILCLVGPPGVGKTSLGKSIANAIQRKFIRMSLGGLHDESEIRGHRKTYIGAMPGRIIQSVKKAGSGNPLFILDEIDKIGSDHRGDPSSALLEVLDPEQNESFYDNYLEMEYDLSKVLFIATANSLNSIQPALLDRMEIIEIGGYSTEEKVEIAKKHLVPDQKKEHGLKSNDVKLKDEVIDYIIRKYTRESGVRSLNRNIAGVMRGIAKSLAMEESYNKTVKHVPEGAIPKDGPSAGITMLTALVSAFKGKAMKKNLAMTGEITLRGKVLPVGGIKEKVLAAKRSGVDTIILCADNRRHVEEIDPRYIGGVEFIYVERMHDVLHYALGIETF
ncbi:UNVERIFIED_CONTAM: hypothetical protein GTU68_045341 [Idotea baltica]|nr:hypothetical protein [Idotea baltica]